MLSSSRFYKPLALHLQERSMRITIDTNLQEVRELIDQIAQVDSLQQIKQQLTLAIAQESKDSGSRVPKEGDVPFVDRME